MKAIREAIARMLKRFKSWLANSRSFLFSRYTKDAQETQEPEKSLIELPQEVRTKLVDTIENLPDNPAEQKAIANVLDKAYTRWQDNPEGGYNSVVILSSPVTSVCRILSDTLQEWTEEKQVKLQILPLTARPDEIESIKLKLEHYLAPRNTKHDPAQKEPEVIVIPNLSWCFLRSLEGLAGIEYLQSLLSNDAENRFWIIGAGQVGWQYLNNVCSLEAYCEEVFTVPEIAAEDLQEWFTPVLKNLQIIFEEARIDKQLLDGEKDNKTNYFERLATVSRGISTIAVQFFLKSIHSQEEDDDDDEEETQQEVLIAQTPKVPDLPDLESADRYLLYSLLLHGDLTISGLAESLGDLAAEVHARVQILRRQGIVKQKDRIIKINPIYYPKLKQELARNNFIINRQ